jgi:nicotinate-nucleotide--dimethylbenzimidazole phosphoribosyltransferase
MNASFSNIAEFKALLSRMPNTDSAAKTAAADRNSQLTKPPAALGRLEELAIWYAGWRGQSAPSISAPQVVIFAGNHGVAALGVSAFPPEVTEQMVFNFQAGGAAINQLCKCFGANLTVKALELHNPTADFTMQPAMDEADFVAALLTGWNAVDTDTDLLVTGEMGIGNTTSAAAIANAIFGGAAEDWVGRGTGVDDAGLKLKARVVRDGLAQHADILGDPIEVLRCLGGRELAAMAGAIVRARFENIPVLLDGFICTAAAAALERAQKGALDHCVASHVSAEAAHAKMLKHLEKEPLLSLGLRLGEGSGAALAIGIMQGAVACHSGMSTFAEAGVSDG